MSISWCISLVGVVLALIAFFAAAFAESKARWIVLGLFGAAVGLGAPALLTVAAPNEARATVVVESFPIAALGNVTRIEGQSSMFSGYIAETDVYTYVRVHDDGSFTLERVPAAGVRIREDATTSTARLEVTQCQRIDELSAAIEGKACSPAVTTLHVPENAVERNFTVDPARS